MANDTLPPVGATVGITGTFRFDPTKPEGEQYTVEADRGAARELTALWRAVQRLAAIDAACLEVCRDNHGPTVGADAVDTDAGRYVCMDEHGRPIIDTSDSVEVIRRLDRLWETAVKRHEDAERRIKELEAARADYRADYDATTSLLADVMLQREELTQRLAAFEALAREAKRWLDSPDWMSGSLQIAEEVARLATPGEDDTHG